MSSFGRRKQVDSVKKSGVLYTGHTVPDNEGLPETTRDRHWGELFNTYPFTNCRYQNRDFDIALGADLYSPSDSKVVSLS